MKQEKDYSLLRPVTIETPVGTRVTWRDGSNAGELLGFDITQRPVFKGWENNGAIVVAYMDLFVEPLCWVEDKPVYKGDGLWHKTRGVRVIADRVNEGGLSLPGSAERRGPRCKPHLDPPEDKTRNQAIGLH